MDGWGLFAQADDNYERFVVAIYTEKTAAKRAQKKACKEDRSHGSRYWDVDVVLLDPTWEELAAERWEFQ